MSCSSTNFIPPCTNIAPVAASTGVPQGNAFGMLILPKGEKLTLLPTASNTPSRPVLVPPILPSYAQMLAGMHGRSLPLIIEAAKESLVLDEAILSAIRVLKAEWPEHKDEEEAPADKPRKKKKKKSSLQLALKALLTLVDGQLSSSKAKALSSKKTTRGASSKASRLFMQ